MAVQFKFLVVLVLVFYTNSASCDESPCADGETLSSCAPVGCDAEYCPLSEYAPQTCPEPIECLPGCVCGFNRHRDRITDECILTADCPPFPCVGPNENYDACPPVCPGETCTDFLNNATCPKYHIGIVVPCKPACRCDKGYYRDPTGICVNSAECTL
ncbi:inducible metalloproteinase inhibitor protein-like [Ostrinia furnacalis]|uniref:inducible metalloproteinase inhibitor protein-like n=1 Tax=Ostrinia furnacalis TaxID=93504 RepID=UPI00103A6C85|nr:inducible metalloproteinase inhibitor protein-like [Ostrinia furnacalis]